MIGGTDRGVVASGAVQDEKAGPDAATSRPATGTPRQWFWWQATALALVVGVVVEVLRRAEYRDPWGLRLDLIDLRVYRMGGLQVIHGASPYDAVFEILGLPFTYPPVSALLMVPFAALPLSAAVLVWTTGSMLALAAVWRLCLPGVDHRVWLALTAGSLLLEPVRQTLFKGQINLVLLLMVLAGLLLAGTPRGAARYPPLVGAAAGLKLTPAAFLGLPLVTRQWRALAGGLAGLAATVAIGFAVLPGPSWRYWTELVGDSDRVGSAHFAGNQSVRGLLARIGADAGWIDRVWLAVALVVAAGALLLARALWTRGARLAAVGACAVAALLASPVSWTHHWVWCIPLGVALAGSLRRRRWRWVAVVAWFGLMVVNPVAMVPANRDAELDWTVWQSVAGNSYVVAAVVWLAIVAVRLPSQAANSSSNPPTV